MNSNGKIRIGVFGGRRGQNIIDVINIHPEAEFVAFCDKNENVMNSVYEKAKENGNEIKRFRNFSDFIEYPEMDAVVLCNYADDHVRFAIEAMKKGKHVLSEVLPCETPAEAVALVEAVEETGMVYAYAENYCYMSAPFEMWLKCKKGEIGDIVYGEGEYLHDCSSIFASITDHLNPKHWRMRMFPTFYCTHSLGPLIMMSGMRPKSVVGYELPPNTFECDGTEVSKTNGGIEMVTMENGAVFKSLHGGLKREPNSNNYMIYGTKGMMESFRFNYCQFNMYKEGEELCKGDWVKYDPEWKYEKELADKVTTHHGSDFFPTHFFIKKIKGEDTDNMSIDVYRALDMGLCGIYAWRSALEGGKPMEIPDLRDKSVRDKLRNDNACCTVEKAGDTLLPKTIFK